MATKIALNSVLPSNGTTTCMTHIHDVPKVCHDAIMTRRNHLDHGEVDFFPTALSWVDLLWVDSFAFSLHPIVSLFESYCPFAWCITSSRLMMPTQRQLQSTQPLMMSISRRTMLSRSGRLMTNSVMCMCPYEFSAVVNK
jgi:hypothetical protein